MVDRAGNIALYTTRLEEIVGLPSEQVLGRDVRTAFSPLPGFDPVSLVGAVRLQGRLPLTRLTFSHPNGRKRTVYVRAERMYDAQGENEGTVVVVDDVTERELLLDSFSRYVSRDLVQRLLARAEPLALGGGRASAPRCSPTCGASRGCARSCRPSSSTSCSTSTSGR